jgi:copper(I)-binding protein
MTTGFRTRLASRLVPLWRSAIPFAMLLLAAVPLAHAQVKVETPWVRAAVPGQLSTGAFMDLTSVRDAAIVKVEAAVAGVAEVHTMEMKGNVMTMRAIEKLDLPAGKKVRLAPGGHHLMLMDLKQPVKNGEIVPIKLTIEYADRKQETMLVPAQVRGLGTAPEAHQHHR